MNTLSGKANLPFTILPPFSMGVKSLRIEFAVSFLQKMTIFLEGSVCSGKQTGRKLFS